MLQATNKEKNYFVISRVDLCRVNEDGAAFILWFKGHRKRSLDPKDFAIKKKKRKERKVKGFKGFQVFGCSLRT